MIKYFCVFAGLIVLFCPPIASAIANEIDGAMVERFFAFVGVLSFLHGFMTFCKVPRS
jgi:hypothetical protein